MAYIHDAFADGLTNIPRSPLGMVQITLLRNTQYVCFTSYRLLHAKHASQWRLLSQHLPSLTAQLQSTTLIAVHGLHMQFTLMPPDAQSSSRISSAAQMQGDPLLSSTARSMGIAQSDTGATGPSSHPVPIGLMLYPLGTNAVQSVAGNDSSTPAMEGSVLFVQLSSRLQAPQPRTSGGRHAAGETAGDYQEDERVRVDAYSSSDAEVSGLLEPAVWRQIVSAVARCGDGQVGQYDP